MSTLEKPSELQEASKKNTVAAIGGATILTATGSSLAAWGMGLTEPTGIAALAGLVGLLPSYAAVRCLTRNPQSLKDHFTQAAGTTVLAGAISGLIYLDVQTKLDNQKEFESLPLISPATMVQEKPKTLAEMHCANSPGLTIEVAHNHRRFRMICPQ